MPDEVRIKRQQQFLDDHVPGFAGPEVRTRTCLYTLPPDQHFVLGLLADEPRIVAAVGAGHAYKFASLLGRILSEQALDGRTEHPVETFRTTRPARDPDGPPDEFDATERDVTPHLAPYDLSATRVAARTGYRVRADWKTILENNRERYHCRANHPEFCLTNFEYGTAGDPRSTPAYERRYASSGRPGCTRACRGTPSTSPTGCRTASSGSHSSPASSPRR